LVNIEGADTLVELLSAHLNPAPIQAVCEWCGGNTNQDVSEELEHPPRTLLLTLNRYVVGDPEARNERSVIIPEELDMSLVTEGGQGIYDLVSVVRFDGGHYAAHVRVGAEWINADDSRVNYLADGPLLFGSDPFMLVYQLRG
jgi:ubiquitin C-terminal hydrolase